MTDPFLESIAAALAGQAVAGLTAAGTKAVEKIRELVRRKSEENPETRAALEGAEDRPAGHPKVRALAERLDHLSGEDPEFAEQLRTEGARVHKELTTGDSGVVNENSGTTSNLVQGHTLGNITFNN